MKIKYIYCLTFLFTYCVFSQTQSGDITYSVHKTESIEEKKLFKEYKDVKKKIDNQLLDLSFKLKFNTIKSEFGVVKSLFRADNEFINEMALLTCRGNIVYITDSKKNTIIEQTPFFGKTYLIKSTFKDYNWILTNESKKIGDYICYKAIYKKDVSGPISKNETRKKINVMAWYCPELSFPFGPFESSGLPGLVLEYSISGLVFTADKIKLSKKGVSIELPKDTDGIEISKSEFEELGKKAFKALKTDN